MNTPTRANFVFAVILVLVFGGMVWWRTAGSGGGGGSGGLPAFSEGLTLTQARERSARSGRPVLVYATADWCGPCRSFKSSTLSRDDVAEAIRRSYEPVYLDVDVAGSEARALGVSSIPAILVLKGDRELDRRVGGMDHRSFMALLAENAGQ